MGNICECRGKGQSHASGEIEGEAVKKNIVVSPIQVTEDDLESEKEEAEDDVVEDLPVPNEKLQTKNRQSVCAEVYGEWNKKKNFKAPVHPKSQEQKERIRNILDSSFLFSSLDVEDLEILLSAFEEVNIKKGVTIIKQGDDGDRLYLIESGYVDVFKEEGGENKKITEMKKGAAFGELALMYNAPRAATVVAAEDVLLWALDRETFSHIVKDAAAKKRNTFDDLLKHVPLLSDMDPYERCSIADGLKTMVYKKGQVIIKEGEKGDTFYMIMEGEAEAVKEDKVVMSYQKGDYFGELSLLKDIPRQATVICKSDSIKLAYMERRSFKRLLGPVEALLQRNQENYKNVMKKLGLSADYLDK